MKRGGSKGRNSRNQRKTNATGLIIAKVRRLARSVIPKRGKPWTGDEYGERLAKARTKLYELTHKRYFHGIFARMIKRAIHPNHDGTMPSKPTPQEVTEAAKTVAGFKSTLYSASEFTNRLIGWESHLWRRGASRWQIRRFKKIVHNTEGEKHLRHTLNRWTGD
ncbi:MAG: hypothetical protein Q8O87_03285 [bacterium]|nr:hypothetical protein [bacterium]